MKWCCAGFEAHYDAAGKRGHAILIGRNELDEPAVTMQYRAVDAGDEKHVHAEVMMSLVIDIAIVYCPWCGYNVRKWYGKDADALSREGLKITF